MADVNTRLYEGLFLLNQQNVASDYAGCLDHLKDIFTRAEAELVAMSKWDERRLAYEIEGQKRGTFILAYFNSRSTQIANIERDCSLSEIVLRALILRADHVGEIELEEAKKQAADSDVETRLRSEPKDDRDGGDDTAASDDKDAAQTSAQSAGGE